MAEYADQDIVSVVVVTLREITDANREAVLALRVAPEQERLVGSVQAAFSDAVEYPHASRGTGRSTRTTSRSGS